MLPAPTPVNEPERIASLRQMLLLSTPDEEAFDRVTRTAQRLFKVPIALVSIIDAQRQWFKSCIGLPVRETGRDVSFCGHAIMTDELFVIENALADPRFADNPLVVGEPHVIFYAGRPLKNAEGFTVGTLCIIDHTPRTLGFEDRRALDDLGCWIEHIFYERELSDLQKHMLSELDVARRASMLDPMLNIWHHAASLEILEKEMLRAFRGKSPLSVLMIDVDHFKQINDEYGHPVGDAILIEFTKCLRSCTRPYDSIGRYGGDEFIVVLPDTNPETAHQIAERLLKALQMFPFVPEDEVIEVTVSVGIGSANFSDDTPEPAELVKRAGTALLLVKKEGRNGIRIFLE
ncbi:MAG: sensor domain-containing diguanylate cyclase [Rhodocyclaceae bacterium]|jgi:diguanylate cyclase (GGDEF)-like protein|nr:MAG: sensor domain-containing diguanylate cyclase [Rhodocyclaceae bacterium]